MHEIKFYGTRGSSPLSGEKYLEYGGATTCVLITFGNTKIMVDAGSGATAAVSDLSDTDELYLFVSHPHLDHLCGIMDLIVSFREKKLHIYGANHGGKNIAEQIESVMGPPLWPVTPDSFGCCDFHDIDEEVTDGNLTAGGINVSFIEGNHPGGCTLYRFEDSDSSVVTGFDFCHLDGAGERLIEFARGADALIYDGSMTEEEFKVHSTWGHSTPEYGAYIAEKANVKSLYITHHGKYTDDELSEWEDSLRLRYPFLHFAKSGIIKNKYDQVLEVGTLLSAEKDRTKLLGHIINAAMNITNSDGGTLYLLKDEKLHFKIMITKSMNFCKGLDGEPIPFPPVALSIKNVCAAAVIEHKTISIPDVYHSEAYDFSGPRNYDKMTGYKTTSVLVIPMENDYGEIIGVLQLINSKDYLGQIVKFDESDIKIVEALASQAAISLTNMNYSEQIGDLLYGFVGVMSTGIDARTPYNANHTRNMVKYADRFFDYQNETDGPYKVDDGERREILISLWLHDIGKLITPLEVMDKATRLGPLMEKVEERFGRIDLLLRLHHAEGKLTDEEYESMSEKAVSDLEFIKSINAAGFLPDEKYERVCEIGKIRYPEIDDTEQPLLTEEEMTKLSIRKGTLTAEERQIMQSHVSYTQKMLSELDFPRGYEHVPFWAGAHHEFLNGKGYPDHLTAEDLGWQNRLITILDVFEALTAKDRPYKPPMPEEKAFAILDSMVNDGQLDGVVLQSYKESRAWES